MSKRRIFECLIILGCSLSIRAQEPVNERRVIYPTEEEIAASKRLNELLKHPTFIALRLFSTPRYSSDEPRTDTPPPYKVKDWIGFQLSVTQNSSEKLIIWNYLSPYYEYRPELMRDGDILPYAKEAEERVERAEREPPSGSMASVTLKPGREYDSNFVNLEDWYEPLGPGYYRLVVRKRFLLWDGDWLESNPVIFVVQPRNPAPIPSTVTIKLVPSAFQEQPEQKLYRLGSQVEITVRVVNNSDDRIKVEVIDLYYGNRLQLFKDGILVPYREETSKLIDSKDGSPRFVDVSSSLFLDPHTASGLQGLNLKDWYGPLAPGSYRLIDRRRFEIDGPWTADSAELLFEVAPQRLPRKVPGK